MGYLTKQWEGLRSSLEAKLLGSRPERSDPIRQLLTLFPQSTDWLPGTHTPLQVCQHWYTEPGTDLTTTGTPENWRSLQLPWSANGCQALLPSAGSSFLMKLLPRYILVADPGLQSSCQGLWGSTRKTGNSLNTAKCTKGVRQSESTT